MLQPSLRAEGSANFPQRIPSFSEPKQGLSEGKYAEFPVLELFTYFTTL